MRNSGITRSGGKKFTPNYEKTFRRVSMIAIKKAGRVVGKQVVKDRIAAIESNNNNNRAHNGGISGRRKKAVRSVVGRDGTLVVLDHAPMAVIQETGGTIRAKDKLLNIQDRRRRVQPGEETFVTKTGLVMAKPKYAKTGERGPRPRSQPKPRLVAVLRQQVTIDRLPEEARLEKIAHRHLERFEDLIQQHTIEGFR